MEAKVIKEPHEIKKFHDSEEDYSDCPPAGFGVRLLALALDGVILAIINQIIQIVAIFLHLGSKGGIGDFGKLPGTFQFAAIVIELIFSFFIIISPLKNSGQTPGKKVLKIRVVRDNFHTNLTWAQIVFREWLVKALSFLLFFISLPMVIFRKDKKVIHDVVCGTQVVRVKEN